MPEPAGAAERQAPPAERQAPTRWRRPFWMTLAVFLVLTALANAYVLWVTRDAMVPDPAAAPAHTYAMVLGNHVFPGGVPSRELAARLETGRRLYRAQLARRIIVTGAVAENYDEPDAMAAWLEARGVPAADIVIDRGGYRTAASMADAAALGVRSMLVVSQQYHLARSLYLAARAGITAVGVPAPNGRTYIQFARTEAREFLARAETLLEVALRGVRGGPIANGAPLG